MLYDFSIVVDQQVDDVLEVWGNFPEFIVNNIVDYSKKQNIFVGIQIGVRGSTISEASFKRVLFIIWKLSDIMS